MCKKQKSLIALSYLADDKRYSNISDRAGLIEERVGINVEQILSLRPTHVIASSFNEEQLVKGLRRAKIKFLTLTAFESFEDIMQNMIKISKDIDCESSGLLMVEEFRRRLNKVPKLQAPLRVLHFSSTQRSLAARTTFDAIVRHVGAINIASQEWKLEFWPVVSIEKVLTSQPQAIVVFSMEDKNELSKMPGWRSLKATQKDHIIILERREINALSHYIVGAVDAFSKQAQKILTLGRTNR